VAAFEGGIKPFINDMCYFNASDRGFMRVTFDAERVEAQRT